MKIKDAVEDRCPTCGFLRKTLEEEQYGCDYCKKVIDLEDCSKYNHRISPHLEMKIFYLEEDKQVETLTFCSWKCFYSKIKEYKDRTDISFIAPPCLSFERDIKDKYCGDFFEYIKE